MRDYRIEYCAMIYILQIYDDKEIWDGILIDADFNYLLALEYLIDVLEGKLKSCKGNYDEDGIEFYSIVLERAIDIYENGVI